MKSPCDLRENQLIMGADTQESGLFCQWFHKNNILSLVLKINEANFSESQVMSTEHMAGTQ